MKKTLVVMAAGMGSRFGGLKQIEPVIFWLKSFVCICDA